MKNALIGSSGFVGTTLQKQMSFQNLYRSTNIQEIEGKDFDLLVCAGAPAQKWIANANPQEDLENITRLMGHLKKVKCQKFILVSTVDVFKNPMGVDENTPVDVQDHHAYGANRRKLESFVEETFKDHLIIRLPGLVGPGLKKNVIFDFLNQNNLDKVDSRGVFQFYPMVNLGADIENCLARKLRLVHLTAEPISVAEIAKEAFGLDFKNEILPHPATYDFQTLHEKNSRYQYSKKETLLAIRSYAQSEAKSL